MYVRTYVCTYICSLSSFAVDLISLTNDQLISMPDLADMLAERTRNTSWVVVMKALITAHNMMVLGNEVCVCVCVCVRACVRACVRYNSVCVYYIRTYIYIYCNT